MSTQHIQKSFDDNLNDVRLKVSIMADMVFKELSDSVQALAERDRNMASDSVAADDLVNASERIIDDLIIKSIVLHQPVASDCRQLIAALRIAKDLERIGDYASNIANHSQTLDELELTGEEQRVIDMGHAVLTMLQEAMESYTDNDERKARTIREQDTAIDELFTKIFADLIAINKSTPENAAACSHLSFIARCMERIGDHITDIAEEILYIIEGKMPEDNREKADETAFIKG